MSDTPIPPPFKDPERAARLFEEAAGAGGPASDRPPPPPPAEMAKHFPDLQILDVIGVGGMGVVYRARHRRLDRLVALKVLPKDLAADPQFAERFAREAKTLASLDHPGIVRVHDFGVVDGLTYLVMEHVDGANLRQVMAAGRLSPSEALAIVPKICEALQYAHDHGVVHRDIKPENVLIDSTGRVKIADFGLAKIVGKPAGAGTLTSVGQVMGTFQYMAPEQYRTPQDVDHRADLYSLGVVLYEMLTGELPVGRFQPPSEAAALDARIDHIVLHALERERALRYQKAEEIRTDIAGLSTPGKGPVPAPKPKGRKALIFAAAALPLGVLAAVLVHAAWGGVIRGTSDAAAREIWKGVAGGVVFATGAVAAILAAVRGVHRRTGVTLAIVHLAALIVLGVIAGNEVARHSRTLPLTSSSAPYVGIHESWKRLLALPYPVPLEALAETYVQPHRDRFLALTSEERRQLTSWGAPLLMASMNQAGRRVWEISRLESAPEGDRVIVTATHDMGHSHIQFLMAPEDGTWRFVLEPLLEHPDWMK